MRGSRSSPGEFPQFAQPSAELGLAAQWGQWPPSTSFCKYFSEAMGIQSVLHRGSAMWQLSESARLSVPVKHWLKLCISTTVSDYVQSMLCLHHRRTQIWLREGITGPGLGGLQHPTQSPAQSKRSINVCSCQSVTRESAHLHCRSSSLSNTFSASSFGTSGTPSIFPHRFPHWDGESL